MLGLWTTKAAALCQSKKVCKVRFVRYTRYGVAPDPADNTKIIHKSGGHVNLEHGYDPLVDLYETKSPLAWKLALPAGCVITASGFEAP